MTYESDNPQFDHLMNNLDSEEIPYKREPERIVLVGGALCQFCRQPEHSGLCE